VVEERLIWLKGGRKKQGKDLDPSTKNATLKSEENRVRKNKTEKRTI